MFATFEREWRIGEVVVASRDVWIAQSRAELLAGVQSRVLVDPGDARSGSVFERVMIDGERYFAKTLGYLEERGGLEFDPELCAAFTRMMRQWEPQVAVVSDAGAPVAAAPPPPRPLQPEPGGV